MDNEDKETKNAFERIERTLNQHTWMLKLILKMENIEMAKIDDVISDVASESAIEDSVITLLGNLTTMIQEAGTDPAKLDAVIASIDANKAKLSAAIVANTPAAPAPAAPPSTPPPAPSA